MKKTKPKPQHVPSTELVHMQREHDISRINAWHHGRLQVMNLATGSMEPATSYYSVSSIAHDTNCNEEIVRKKSDVTAEQAEQVAKMVTERNIEIS